MSSLNVFYFEESAFSSQSFIAFIFSGFVTMPSADMIWLKYLIFFIKENTFLWINFQVCFPQTMENLL